MARLSVLHLCDDVPDHAETVLEHIASFDKYSRHEFVRVNPRNCPYVPALVWRRHFDAIFIHYSICILYDEYLSRAWQAFVRLFPGVKVQFIQDDYRRVNAMIDRILELKIDVVLTLVPEKIVPEYWGRLQRHGVRVETTLAGYVPERLTSWNAVPLAERSLDVVYRGREIPFWLGKLAQEKAFIAREFTRRAPGAGLRCDLASREGERIYGMGWYRFLESGRAALGTESGASITDFDGEAQRQVEAYLEDRPGASFQEVAREVLVPFEGNLVLNVVSPRVFEAIALRTALVLFPGDYSGVLQPHEHYIPLAKDFSNFDEVVAKIRDDGCLAALVDRAWHDVIASGRYSHATFVSGIDRILEETCAARAAANAREDTAIGQVRQKIGYHLAYARMVAPSIGQIRQKIGYHLAYARMVAASMVSFPNSLARVSRLAEAKFITELFFAVVGIVARRNDVREILIAALRDGSGLRTALRVLLNAARIAAIEDPPRLADGTPSQVIARVQATAKACIVELRVGTTRFPPLSEEAEILRATDVGRYVGSRPFVIRKYRGRARWPILLFPEEHELAPFAEFAAKHPNLATRLLHRSLMGRAEEPAQTMLAAVDGDC